MITGKNEEQTKEGRKMYEKWVYLPPLPFLPPPHNDMMVKLSARLKYIHANKKHTQAGGQLRICTALKERWPVPTMQHERFFFLFYFLLVVFCTTRLSISVVFSSR